MENNFLKDFKENVYEPSAEKFLNQTWLYLSENRDKILENFYWGMKGFCTKLAMLQEQVPIDAGCIQISFTYTSIYFGNPQIRFDAYDKYGVFGGNLLHEDMDFPWAFQFWKEWEDTLKDAVKERHYEMYVSEERISVMMCEKLKMLLYLLLSVLKYPLEQLDNKPWFKNVKKESEFAVSFGEFEDWQKTLYGEFPFVDIFLNVENKPLRWQKYNQLVFKDKSFENLDLSKIRFTDCHFIHSTIRNTVFYDTNFLGCRFHNVTFENCEFYGSYWKDCLIQKSRFQRCSWWKEDFDLEEPIDDFYRMVFMESCSFNRVVIEDSNLKNLKVMDEHMKDVEIIDNREQAGGEKP